MAVAKNILNVMDMRYLRSMCGLICIDLVNNEEVQKRTGVLRELA